MGSPDTGFLGVNAGNLFGGVYSVMYKCEPEIDAEGATSIKLRIGVSNLV